MALKRTATAQDTSANSTVEYENLAEGEHEGRLVYIADLGLQSVEYKGEKKPDTQQIALGIEIVGNSVLIDGQEKPRFLWTKPINIYYTLTERGKEYEYYKIFNPTCQEGEVADWDAVLGTPCNVIVKHNTSNGRTYDNIASLSAIPAKYHDGVAPARITDMAVGDADDDNNPAQKAMFGIPRATHARRLDPRRLNPPKVATAKAPDSAVDFDDAIPF